MEIKAKVTRVNTAMPTLKAMASITIDNSFVIKGIKIALVKFRSQTIYCILGLMIGSIYAIIMGPTTLDVPQAPLNYSTFHIIFFILGGAIIIGLENRHLVYS